MTIPTAVVVRGRARPRLRINSECKPGQTQAQTHCTPKPPPKPLPGKGPGAGPPKQGPQFAPPNEDAKFHGLEPRRPLAPRGVPDHVKAQGEKIAKSVTPAEREALTTYTNESNDPGSYAQLNKSARKCPDTLDCLGKKDKEVFDHVNAIASRSKLDKPVIVYRGISLKGDERAQFIDSARAAVEKGGTITFHGVGSTSLDAEVGGTFGSGGVVFEIKAKSGAYIDPVSKVGGEQEFIVPHGKKYKVVGVQGNREFLNAGGRNIATATVVQLEEV